MGPKGNFLVFSFYFSAHIKWAFVLEVFNDIHIFLAKCVNGSLRQANSTSPSFKLAGKDPHPANSSLIGLCCKKQLKLKARFIKNVCSVYVSVCIGAFPALQLEVQEHIRFPVHLFVIYPVPPFFESQLTSAPGFLCE